MSEIGELREQLEELGALRAVARQAAAPILADLESQFCAPMARANGGLVYGVQGWLSCKRSQRESRPLPMEMRPVMAGVADLDREMAPLGVKIGLAPAWIPHLLWAGHDGEAYDLVALGRAIQALRPADGEAFQDVIPMVPAPLWLDLVVSKRPPFWRLDMARARLVVQALQEVGADLAPAPQPVPASRPAPSPALPALE